MYSQNQKMHDLYATMHISQMVLPDAFWVVLSQIFFQYLRNLNFPKILRNKFDSILPKKYLAKPFEKYA